MSAIAAVSTPVVARRARILVAVFAVWTVYVWTTRIVNVLGSADWSPLGKAVTVALSLSLIGLAIAAVWSAFTGRALRIINVLAGWTVAVWVVRLPTLLTLDVDVPFKAVHTVLGIISIVLAVVTWRAVTVSRDREPASTLT